MWSDGHKNQKQEQFLIKKQGNHGTHAGILQKSNAANWNQQKFLILINSM